MPNPWELYKLTKDLESCENLHKTSAFFDKLTQRKDLISIIPHKLYYKQLLAGKGQACTRKVRNVSFQFSYHLPEDDTKEFGSIKKEDIACLIPGVAHALIGMKKGEIRKLYIHPEYGYGDDTYFPPNSAIIAKIQLIDFELDEKEHSISSPISIKTKNYDDLLTRYEKLRSEEFYANGIDLWDFIKKGGSSIDFPTFLKAFQPISQAPPFLIENKEKFLTDFQWSLTSHHLSKNSTQNKKGHHKASQLK
jgi:peptidylprolyl isomerase